ncbi:uncharacterized protein LOC103517115 [Diaphorina citri]|uniref:Uncharacterized protein LOC103517115 n=1 Tax=Diaphorina citri TaxID=121845 RepID=A0A3Q0J9L8_DIACI|nr:uncharacterized protein LOC103517115 [Diaphorina citri]
MASDNDKDDDLNLVGYIDDMTLVENDNEDKEEGEISNGSSSSIGYNQMVLSHRSESILSLSDISSTKSYDEPLIRDMTLLDNDQPTESPSLHELELEKNKLIERIKSKLNTPNSSEKVMRDIEKLDIIKMSIAEIKSRGTDNPKLKHREKRKSKKSKKSSKRKKKSIIPSVAEQEFTNYSSSRLLAKPGIPPVHGVQEDELFPNLDEVINATPFTGGQNLKIAVRNDLFKHKVFNDSEIDSSIKKQKSISFYNPSSPTSSHSTAETISDLSELNCSREKLQYSCRDSREKLQWNVLQDPAVEFSEEKYSKRKKRHSRKKIKSPIKSHYSRDETMSPTLSQRRPSKSPHERHHSRIGQSKSTHPTSSLDTSPHKRHHSGSRQRRRPSDRSTSIHLKSRHSKHSRRKDRSRTYSSHSDSGSSSKGKSSSRRQQRRQCSRSASSSSSQSIEITKSVLTNQSVIRSPDKSADVSLFQGVNKSLLTFSSNERTPGTSQYSSSSPKVEAVPASSGLPNLNSSYNIPSLGLDLNRDISEHPKKPNLSQLVIPCHQQTSSSPSIVHAFHLESNCESEDTNRNICDQSDVSNYDVISMDAGSDSLESDILLDNNNLSKPVMNNKSCEHVESTHPLNTMSVKERDTLENIPDKESDTLVYIPGKETDILENLPDKESDILENIPDKVSDTLGNIPDKKSDTLDNIPGKETDTLENLVKDQMHCNLSTNKCQDPTESLMNESCSRIASGSNENQKVNNREIVVHELEIEYLLHNPAIPDYVANGSADFFAELQQVLCSARFNTKTKHDSLAIEKWFVIINSIYYDLIYKKNNTTFEKIKKYCHILDLFRDYFNKIVSQPKNKKRFEVEESNFDKELAEIKKSNSDKKELVEVEESNFDKELVEIKKSNSDKKELAKVEDSNSDKKEFAEIEEINSDKKELGEVEDSNFDKKEFVELNDSNSKEKESVQVEDGDSDKKVLSEIGNDPVNKKELDHSRNEDGKDCQNMNMSENIEYDRMKKSFAKTNAQVQIHRMTMSPKNLSSKDSPQRSLLTSAEYTESSLLENSFEAPTRGHAPKAISFKRMSLDSHSQINEESTVPIKLSFRRSSGDTWINLSKENLVDDRNEIVPNTKIGVHRFPASYAKLIAMENGKRHKQNVVNSPSKACHESKAIDFKSHQQSKETTLSELRSCTTERKGNESSVDLEKSSDNEALVYESKQHRPSQKSRKQKQLYDEYSSDEEEHDLRATDEDTDDISGITGINKGNGNITPLTNTNLVGDKSDNLKHEVVIKNKNQHDKLCASKAKKKKLGKFNIANFIKHKGSKKENVL